MRLAKDLVGKPVITISDGKVIGEVKDVYLSADLSTMAGAHLGKKGFVKRKKIVIPASSVVLFGIDVILVNNDEAITNSRELEEAKEWLLLNDLIGREVETPGGTMIGKIGDIVFNEMGAVSGFALSKIQVEGPIKESGVIPRSSVVGIGAKGDAMTVNMASAEKPLDEAGTILPPINDDVVIEEDEPIIEEIAVPEDEIVDVIEVPAEDVDTDVDAVMSDDDLLAQLDDVFPDDAEPESKDAE